MNRIIKCAVVLAAFCVSMTSVANTAHVIVAFDRVIPHHDSIYRDARTLNKIDEFIKRKIQFDSLYLSVVGYAMNGTYPDIEDFVVLYSNREGAPVLWQHYNSLRDIFPFWPMGEPTQVNGYDRPASMQSLAKPYCVMETALKDIKYAADATFIIFITDEEVQGVDDDYNGEWNSMRWYNITAYDRIRKNVFDKLQSFNETYRFELRNRNTIDEEYVMVSYELLPVELPSIYSVSNLPSPLPIKRVRGGYNLTCQVESHNPHYEVRNWAVYNSSGTLIKRDNEGKVFIKSDEFKDGDTLEVRMILRISDDLYGGVLLSHKNCTGMALKQSVKLPDEAKVLGIIPLSDVFWMWFPDDVLTAVMTWDLLILLALIAITAFVFYRIFVVINSYHPDNKDIKLTKL